MRILICLLALAVTLTCCKSNKRMIRSEVGYVSTQPVEVVVQEKVQDILIVEEEPVTVKKEKVGLTDGADLMRYCIIVGSFIYRQNAINLRSDLMRRGFLGCSIMQNSEGMYRVSAVCDDTHADAARELIRIRRQYPQFRDAWLLEVKED